MGIEMRVISAALSALFQPEANPSLESASIRAGQRKEQ